MIGIHNVLVHEVVTSRDHTNVSAFDSRNETARVREQMSVVRHENGREQTASVNCENAMV